MASRLSTPPLAEFASALKGSRDWPPGPGPRKDHAWIRTAGPVATGLDVPRVVRWACAIAGDLVWFAILPGTSIAVAAVADDDRVIGGVVLLALLIVPSIAQRLFPALRDPNSAGTRRSSPRA